MEEPYPIPGGLLNSIKEEKVVQKRGRLKIFFSYASGTGKTFSMLITAHAAKRRGLDVLVGYVDTHARSQTDALLNELDLLPLKKTDDNNASEFDIDAALQRKPDLILVDELAHANAKGCRHGKRYQDVEELLRAGIDVYTTVNVQHIESLNDMVASITGNTVHEHIPDKIFDNADEVELIDIEPQELIERLRTDMSFQKDQAKKALEDFFSLDNLAALREIALRRCADRINKRSETAKIRNGNGYCTNEHILVCLSSSPTNPKVIRTAARMAYVFNGSFTALFVETPDFVLLSEENKKQLRSNIRLAEQLGATIETVYGDEIAFQISEFARLSGVSKIVIGRNNAIKKFFPGKLSLIEKLISYSPELDIYMIPAKKTAAYKTRKAKQEKVHLHPGDLIKSILSLLAATIVGYIFSRLGFSEANIITVYILCVLITAVVTAQRAYSLISSVISVLIFNYLFTDPRFTLHAYDSGYPATFFIMFLAAFITSTLAAKLKQHAKHEAQTAYRTKVLFDTNRFLQKAEGKNSIVSVTANQLIKLLGKDIVFYTAENGDLSHPQVFLCTEHGRQENYISKTEQAAAAWVLKNNKRAGASTATLSNANCLYLAVRMNGTVFGIVGIAIDGMPLEAFENSIVLSILGECALAMENEKIAKEKEEAAVLAKNEQLRANLLRSISHDLRTPLTSISGNANILLASGDSLSSEKKKQLYSDIYDDSLWLINLVENLLAVTRIEDGTMKLRISAELMEEVIAEALRHINRQSRAHQITVIQEDDLLLAKMDARLIIQVIINIVDNAVKYTPKGSLITITSKKEGKTAVIEIADNGPGIPDETKSKIFDMFFTGNNKIADSRRSLGLGLALCKSIISAHNGKICVFDNKPNGAVFRITLPAEEVPIHE